MRTIGEGVHNQYTLKFCQTSPRRLHENCNSQGQATLTFSDVRQTLVSFIFLTGKRKQQSVTFSYEENQFIVLFYSTANINTLNTTTRDFHMVATH